MNRIKWQHLRLKVIQGIRSSFAKFILVFSLIVISAKVIWIIAPAWSGFEGKTLWDLLELIIMPLVLASGALWFNRQERNAEREIAIKRTQDDRELSTERRQNDALQAYLDKMTELMLEYDLRNSSPYSEVRGIARARTLTILSDQNSINKGSIINFIYRANLISHDPVISMADADLSNAHLSNTNLTASNLSSVNLSKADLFLADLSQATLSNANLSRADLLDSRMVSANLDKADFEYARLMNVEMQGAHANNAIFAHADLAGAELDGADLNSASFSEAWMSGASMTEANLTLADFWKAELGGAILARANLRNSVLRKANLIGADLSYADLTDASLEGAIIDRVILRGATLLNTKGTGIKLKQAWSLRGAIMPDGSRYSGQFKLKGDILDAQQQGINPSDRDAMAQWYKG